MTPPPSSLFSKNKLRSEFIRLTLIVTALFMVLVINSKQAEKNDLPFTAEWSHFPGAEIRTEGVNISPVDLKIVHQDGSISEPNPPINVMANVTRVKVDFEISIGLIGAGDGANFRIYGELPVIFDEWRREGKSINISASSTEITLKMWDGNSSTSFDMRSYPVSLKEKTTINLKKIGENINIFLDGKELGYIPEHNIFKSGQIWFGADANINGNGFTLTDVKVKALENGEVKIDPPLSFSRENISTETLRNYAEKRKIKIGSAISFYPLFFDDEYREIALEHFSIITPENSFKPQFLHPLPKVYTFEEGDALVEIALLNDIAVHGHTLVWGKANPEWIGKSKKEERKQIMLDHIKNVVTHFKGKVVSWDVVNEIMSDKHKDYEKNGAGIRDNIWFEAMGEEYIELALRAARESDPDAKLYINEYALERDGERWDAFIRLLKRLRQKNVPLDGVGFEAHVYHDTDEIEAKILKKHIEELSRIGLLSRVSEIDVYGDDPNVQSRQYTNVLRTCLSVPTCVAYSMWGITDKYGSTAAPLRYPPVFGDSLLWDSKMKPKVGFFNLLETLK